MASKTLYLVRHAKSSWDNPGLADIDRPLGQRGLRDAPRMGHWLAQQDGGPELMISSPANRARTTAAYLARALGREPGHLRIEKALYFEGVEGMFRVLSTVDDSVGSVMLAGHNPNMTSMFNRLSGERMANMPTCAIAIIELELEHWRAADQVTGSLLVFQRPKGLD